MKREDIKAPLDDGELNKLNYNFKQLFDAFGNVVEVVSEKAYGDVIDAAKLNWKEPVSSQSNLPTDAEEGDTRMTRNDGKVYRFNGEEWNEIQQIDAGPVNEVERRFNDNLNSVKSQLAQTTDGFSLSKKRSNQKDFFAFHERNSGEGFSNSYSVIGDRHFIFNVGIADGESVEHEFRKNPLDDFIKWTTTTLNSFTPGTVKEDFSFDNVGGGSLSGSDNNFYATTIGTTVTHTFTGTDIYFNHFTDNRGGVWRCSIDGDVVRDISTHIDAVRPEELTVSVGTRLIADGLENTQHTLVMEFIGDDPNNPPRGGADTSRGWIRVNDGSSGNPSLNRETFEITALSGSSTEMLMNSNKEFAFRIKANGADYSDEWVPEHNSLGSMFVGDDGRQELFIDGVRVSNSTPVSDVSFNEAKIVQKLNLVNPHDTVSLGTLIITATISSKGVSLSTKVTWERETEVKTGYVNMFTINPSFGSELVSSMGKKYDLTVADGSLEDVDEEAPNAFIVLNPSKFPNHYMYMQNFATEETLRLNESNRRGQPNGEGLYFLQHRDANLQKLYPHTYSNHIAMPGEQYYFEGHFGFGMQPGVAELLG